MRSGVAASGSSGHSAEAAEDLVVGRPGGAPASGDPAGGFTSAVGTPLRPGEWHEPPPKMPTDPKELKKLEEMAKKRGKDWGIPDAAQRSVPVSRPIQVECFPDHLVLLPEDSRIVGRSIPLGPRTETAVNPFITAVWGRMDQWGIAGNGMYWRPILKVAVAPGAERRFVELEASLAGSGLRVERR
jgi:hypothetical protein